MMDQTTLTFLLIVLALMIIASGYIGHMIGVTEGQEGYQELVKHLKKKELKKRKEIRRLLRIIKERKSER